MTTLKKLLKNRIIIIIIVTIIIPVSAYTQNIYTQSLRDVDGNTINLQNYQGKKLVFVVLPMEEDTLSSAIKDFSINSDTSVQVIGILSEEDGYTTDKKDSVKSIYNNTRILLTEMMKSRKGSDQSALMQWLTDRTKNRHFNMDVNGIGYKFFINRQGVLHAILGPRVSITAPIVSRILSN